MFYGDFCSIWHRLRVLSPSATVLKAVCDSNGKPPNLPPCGTETNQPIDAKFGRGDYVGQGTHYAKYHGRRFSGAGSAYGQNITSLDFFFVFFCVLFFFFNGSAECMLWQSFPNQRPQHVVWSKEVPFGGHKCYIWCPGVRGLKEFQILTPNMGGPI